MRFFKVLTKFLILVLFLQSVEAVTDIHFDIQADQFTFSESADQNAPFIENTQDRHDAKHKDECCHSHFHSVFMNNLATSHPYFRKNINPVIYSDNYLSVIAATLLRPPTNA